MLFTGIEGGKRFSVNRPLFKKEWEISKGEGKKIYVIPSHKTYVRMEETEIRDLYDLKKFLYLEIEEKFGNVLWDVRLAGNRYCLALAKGFDLPEDAYALDPEPFSLTRAARALGETNCWVLDLGKRKTTLVKVSEGELSSYRVVLKGGDFIDEYVSGRLGIDREEARGTKLREGLENDAVKEAFGRIMSSLGRDLKSERVILSGGGSRLKGIEEHFPEGIRVREGDPELFSAFGASLKFVLRDCSPDFREEELSERDLKRAVITFGLSFLLFIGANVSLSLTEKNLLKRVRSAERKEFKRFFPNLPPVAVRDQLRSMVGGERFPLLKKMRNLFQDLPAGIKIYRIEFTGGTLKIVGETESKEVLDKLKPKTLKETPEGSYEFEVEL